MKLENKIKQPGYWREHLESWKSSELTQKAYCEQAGISYGSFVYQHTRMTRKAEKTAIKFIEKKIPEPQQANNIPRLQLMLPNGIRIGIEGELNTGFLETVLRAAGNVSC
ncbi:TPA: IS66 family insertion sequence element accessory protein TnpA [Legionella pneumophila]|nr:hypothetical protein [Legionella pneumophila]